MVMNGKETKLDNLYVTLPEVQKETAITFRFEVIAADGNVEYKEEKTIKEYPLDRN